MTKNRVKGELKTVSACRYTSLSKKKQKTLEELKHREDKRGAVVILDIKDYNKESEKQLNNTEQHKHLEHDPTTENNATVNKVIARFKDEKLIGRNVSDGLKVESPR